MKSFLSLFTCMVIVLSLKAQTFSDETRISLLTCSAGSELYTKFGHSAIRIQDRQTGQDVVFNYGIFDFDTPGFYTKFLRGKLLYRLAQHSTRNFVEVYRRENREVIEQEIYLNAEQKRRVLEFLAENYKPENQYYLYDFFLDNCATRIRDVIYHQLDGQLSIPKDQASVYTFREMLDLSLEEYLWPKFGMDLILGTPTDQPLTFSHEMFLPDFLSDNLAEGKVQLPDTTFLLMGAPKVLVSPPTSVHNSKQGLWSPLVVWSFFAALVLLFTFFAPQKMQKRFDYFLFMVLGLLGTFVLFMWLGTEHYPTKSNWNLLWLHPLYLIVPFVYGKKSGELLLGLQAIILLLLLLTWGRLPQEFNVAFIPIWVAIGIRCFRKFRGDATNNLPI